MERKKFTGQTCVGDLRLSPLDVGFDLRSTNQRVILPVDFDTVGIEQDGDIWLIEGCREEMIQAIRDAGYSVGPEYCTQNNGDCPTCSLVNYGRDCMNNPMEVDKASEPM